jgi:succinate-semialdehyde dehydrogenase/glutarate-semialdehyde dehydrogenase
VRTCRKLGPLIHSRAVDKVRSHVDDAVAKGAQVLVGGRPLDGAGAFFAPTVLSDVPADALVNDEETFGPVAALVRFETEEEVVRLANATPFGLAGYFFSRDVGRVWRVAEALEVGMVGANTGLISQAVIPFGGVKESGLGALLFFFIFVDCVGACADFGWLQGARVATVLRST